MNEFSPYICHSGCYNWNEIHAARKKIGEHKQQAKEREQEETKRYQTRCSKAAMGRASWKLPSKLLYCLLVRYGQLPKRQSRLKELGSTKLTGDISSGWVISLIYLKATLNALD